MLSVPWFLGWALRPYIQINSGGTTTTPTTASNSSPAADDNSGGNSRLKAKAQVAQLSSPSAARHVTFPRTPSPTSPTRMTAVSKGPYPVNTQPITAKAGNQTSSAPPSTSSASFTKTTATRTSAAPPPTTAPKPPASPTGPSHLVSTKNITLKMSAEWVQRQLEKFRFSFDEADRDRNGHLSFDEVLQVITKHGFKGSKEQAKVLFTQLDADHDQKLTREEFSAALDRLPKVTIKEFVLRKTFQQMDKDGSGKLSRKEIEDTTKNQGGLDIPAEKIAQLLIVLSKDTKDQVVDYEEFLQVFGVHSTGDIMQEVFHKLDTDRSGYLTKQEIMAAINTEHELKLRAAKISDLLIAWHKDDDKKINYQEFVKVWTMYKD